MNTVKIETPCVLWCRSEESFTQYFGEMPWLAVPYTDEARRSRLNRLYGIQGTSVDFNSGSGRSACVWCHAGRRWIQLTLPGTANWAVGMWAANQVYFTITVPHLLLSLDLTPDKNYSENTKAAFWRVFLYI